MGISQETLRIVVGILGGLMIVTRLYGVINPAKTKQLGARIARLGSGWVRAIYVIVGLLGAWILYSALVLIFTQVPVFLVLSFLTGLILLLSGMFIMHPEWFPEVIKGILVDRRDLFVRFICFIGVLAGVFFLLAAIFGSSWGGR